MYQSIYMRRMYHNKIPMQMLHASASIIFISKQSMPYQTNIIACALQSTASATFGMRYWQFALCPLVPLPRRKTIVNDFDIWFISLTQKWFPELKNSFYYWIKKRKGKKDRRTLKKYTVKNTYNTMSFASYNISLLEWVFYLLTLSSRPQAFVLSGPNELEDIQFCFGNVPLNGLWFELMIC